MLCLYCERDIAEGTASKEHAIPQFLGGGYAPSRFQLKNVCQRCNNDLGLFVDGSFARSWFVTNSLALGARKLYLGQDDAPLPLVCMGPVIVPGLLVPDGYVCECWLGPFGDRVLWIRPHDETLYWYSGGNPIAAKQRHSTAYVLLADGAVEHLRISMASIRAFGGRKIRRILCHEGADLDRVSGFVSPNEAEQKNLLAIRSAFSAKQISASLSINVRFDERFAGKLALAIGFVLFGEQFLLTRIAKEARKACMAKPGAEHELRGSGLFDRSIDFRTATFAAYPGAVAFCVLNVGEVYALVVSIDQGRPLVVEIASSAVTSHHLSDMGNVLLVFPHIKQAIDLTLTDLIGHRTGTRLHPELAMVDRRIAESACFFDSLGAAFGSR